MILGGAGPGADRGPRGVCRPRPVDNYRVDTKSRVCVRGCYFSVRVRYAGRRGDVRRGAEVIEVLDGATVVARHGRARKGEEVLVLDHYLEVLALKPGALLSAPPLARANPRRLRAPATPSSAAARLGGRARGLRDR